MNREDNQLITKSNQLIQCTITSMDIKELKLATVLLAEYRNAWDKDNLCTQTILNRREFLNYLGINDSGMNYERLNNTLKHFQQKAVCEWVNSNKGTHNITPYFKNIEYNSIEEHGNTDIVFTWNEYITLMVVDLDKNFTKLFKRIVLSLNSKKSMVLYELLKSYQGRKYPPTLTVDELKEKLDMQAPSYNVFKDFYKRGIEEPLKEINENTDIRVLVVKNRDKSDKRKIVSLTFKIKNQAEKKVWWENEFPKVKLTEEEFTEVKQWTYPVHHKTILNELQEKLNEVGNVKGGHYKWLKSRYENTIKKQEKEPKEEENRKSELSICKLQSGRINGQPSYDLEQIKFDALLNTEIK